MMQSTRLEEYDYYLPDELIAQHPSPQRDASRLMLVDCRTGSVGHHVFHELPGLLQRGDLLVFNNSRVEPIRLLTQRADTGSTVEVLPVAEEHPGIWRVLLKPGRRLKEGARLLLPCEDGFFELLEKGPNSRYLLAVRFKDSLARLCQQHGQTPLPPYIKRPNRQFEEQDRQRYQTVYAEFPGSVAAPTAGLHFTARTMADLAAAGVETAFLCLHVGPATFQPVRTEHVEQHRMEPESYSVPPAAAEAINRAKSEKRRILAVGTTAMRTLEHVAAQHDGRIVAGQGATDLFIVEPYRFRAIDGLLTNFHLPRTSLLMAIAALAGLDLVKRAYREAVHEKYRFYSYGDCMLILGCSARA